MFVRVVRDVLYDVGFDVLATTTEVRDVQSKYDNLYTIQNLY